MSVRIRFETVVLVDAGRLFHADTQVFRFPGGDIDPVEEALFVGTNQEVVADCLQFERVVWQIDSFDEHSFERVYKDFAESEKENSIVRDVEVRQFRIFLRAAAQTGEPVREGAVGIEDEYPFMVAGNIEFVVVFNDFGDAT